MWGGGERGRGRGRSVTRLYGHETSSSPSSTCLSTSPPTSVVGTKFSSATDEKFERKRLFVTAATASLRLLCPALPVSGRQTSRTVSVVNIVTGDGGKSLYYDWHSQASNSLSLSLSLDCRRYCSFVETWRHISQGWTLHRIKAGLVDSKPTVCSSGCCIACST